VQTNTTAVAQVKVEISRRTLRRLKSLGNSVDENNTAICANRKEPNRARSEKNEKNSR
jgi:hypothetical protein